MPSTTILALATASFVGSHLLLSHPLRPVLAARLGEKGFLGVYAIIALVTLGWTIATAVAMPPQAPLWIAGIGIWHGASLIMLLAAILLIGSLSGNPAMVDPTGHPKFPATARGVYAITRHPMMWAFMLWAIVHIMLWGSPRNLILAAGIGVLALIGPLGQDAKKARLIGQPWREWQAMTSFVPFAALLTGRAAWRRASPGGVALIGGLIVWAGATWLHPVLAGPWLWIG